MAIADITPEYKVRPGGNGNGREVAPLVSTDGTNRKMLGGFTLNQERALKALQTKGYKETMDSVAQRAGVSRKSLYRYLAGSEFAAELRRRVLLDIKGDYAPFMRAVLDAAMERGPGQAALVRVVLDKIGDPVIDHSEHTNREAGFEIDDLDIPIDVKRAIVHHMEVIEALLAPYRDGGPTPPRQLEPPRPARNVTPLDEVELDPTPSDLQSPVRQD